MAAKLSLESLSRPWPLSQILSAIKPHGAVCRRRADVAMDSGDQNSNGMLILPTKRLSVHAFGAMSSLAPEVPM